MYDHELSDHEPQPGCLKDWRGCGGQCIHPELQEQEMPDGIRCTCAECGKFVGYRREAAK